MRISVFLISLSSIAFEILLTRVFSIAQWNHLSFMVISIALFGMAASGTFLGIYQTKHPFHGKECIAVEPFYRLNLLYAFSTLVSFIWVNRLPLDYFKLPVQALQGLYLLTTYLALALPFFFAGMILSLAYMTMPHRTGTIYYLSMSGSALGALLPLALLGTFEEGRLIVLTALLPLLPCLASFPSRTRDVTTQRKAYAGPAGLRMAASLSLALLIAFIAMRNPALIRVTPSDYKGLSQMLQMPHTRVNETFSGLRGRIDRVESPFLRHFPGLSLNYSGALPSQCAVFKDGDGQLVCYENEAKRLAFAAHTLAYGGYALCPSADHVLILQNGGGTAVPCAISFRPRRLTVIENHPRFADIIGRHYGIAVMSQNPRSFLIRSGETFDIIHLENWGSSLPGSAALSQDHMFTRQAFEAYLEHLADGGLLIVSRRLMLPPSQMIRLCGTAVEALKALQIKAPRRHLVVLRNWDTFTLIVSKRPMEDLDPVASFAKQHSFDLVWPPHVQPDLINRYNRFDRPYHFLSLNALVAAYASGTETSYYREYALDVSPQSDNRPFPDKFLKWSKIKLIHQMTGSQLYRLLLSGEVIIAAVFIEAVLVSLLLLFLPLIRFGGRTADLALHRIIYFWCIGTGFILFEMFCIGTYFRILNDPVLSFTMVLSGLLVFSGSGGMLTQYLKAKALQSMLLLLCILLLLMLLTMEDLLVRMLALPAWLGVLLSLALMMPAGVLLGVPFPMAMRHLLHSPSQRAYAWAVNGCASVLASIVAAQMAISLGLKSLLGGAAACYLAAWLSAQRR